MSTSSGLHTKGVVELSRPSPGGIYEAWDHGGRPQVGPLQASTVFPGTGTCFRQGRSEVNWPFQSNTGCVEVLLVAEESSPNMAGRTQQTHLFKGTQPTARNQELVQPSSLPNTWSAMGSAFRPSRVRSYQLGPFVWVSS